MPCKELRRSHSQAHVTRHRLAVKVFDGHLPMEMTMTRNNANPSYILTFDDAVNIWQRHWSGEFQNRIAAVFDVNPGRVNEVLKERKHVGSRQVALKKLDSAA